ncbi:MAG: sigma-70 family RNA polymerase sigma factor, partial [Kiritimatiellae bacterium]|nr:sigma-70 family RNA polymerase sigma factor [Kiritimatiellia bacterium]
MTIVEELRRDRESGAKRLESEYKAGLMTLARNFCVDESDAEELVNRTFAAVVEGIDDYLEQSAFFAWMCQILKNIHALDTRRKSHGDIIYPGQVPEIADEDAQEEIYRNLDASLVREAIKLLPQDQRETLLLHYFMDMPVAKIAKFLSIPVGTVNSRLHYARKALATKLGVKMHEMAGKPGGKAVLLALLLCGITALGAGARLAVTRLMSSPSVAVEQQADNSKASGQATSDRRQAEACGQATCDMRHAEASNLSTFQPFNLSTDNSQGENMNISKSTRAAAMLAAATVATSAAATAQIVPDGNAQVVMQDGRTVLIYNTNG